MDVLFGSLEIGSKFRLHDQHGALWLKMVLLKEPVSADLRDRNAVCIESGDDRVKMGHVGFVPDGAPVYQVP